MKSIAVARRRADAVPGTWKRVRPRSGADVWVAGAAALAVGGGLAVAVASASAELPIAAVAGGAAVLAGLVTLVAGGWLNGLLVIAVAVPMPALLATDALRIATVAPLTAAVVLGWLLEPGSRRASFAPRSVRYAVLLLLAAFTASSVLPASRLASARELLNMLVLFTFFLLALERARDARAGDHAINAIVAVAAVCGVLAVLEMTGVLPGQFPRFGTPYNRAALGFGQPNGLGLFLAISVPLAVHVLRVSGGAVRALAAFALVATAAGLFATFSRGSWLSVIAGAAALGLVRDTRLLVRFIAGVVVFAAVLDITSGGMLADTAQRTLTDWVVEQRAALMVAGVLMFLAHPLLGVGPGGFAVELDAFGAQVPELWDYLATPHNAYVQVAAEGGIIGLAAFVVFLAVCFGQLVRRANEAARVGASARELSARRCLLWSFATACAAGLVVWPFAHGTGQAMLLLLALGLARDSAG